MKNVGVLGSDFEKSSRKSSMPDFGQHVFTISPMMVVQDSKRSYLLTLEHPLLTTPTRI